MNSLPFTRLKINCGTVAVPPPTDSSGSSAAVAAAASAIRSVLVAATCLLVSAEALLEGAYDDTVGAARRIGRGDAGLKASTGVAARRTARAAAIRP